MQSNKGPTPALREKLVEGLRLGLTWKLVAAYAGVNTRSLHRWRTRGAEEASGPYRELVDALEKAEAEGAAHCLATVLKAARAGTWQAAAWVLERRHGFTVQRANIAEIAGSDAGEVDPEAILKMWVQIAPHRVRQVLEAAEE